MIREADQADFSATLLAMAGHDLRQPLQLITSAHDVLAQTLASEQQREELSRAGDATAQLASRQADYVNSQILGARSASTAEAVPSKRAAARAILVLFNIVESPLLDCAVVG